MLSLLLLAAAAPAPAATACPTAQSRAADAPPKIVGPRPLGQEPPAELYRTVWREVGGCWVPVKVAVTRPR